MRSALSIAMLMDERYPPDPRVDQEAARLSTDGHVVALFVIDDVDFEIHASPLIEWDAVVSPV